MKFNWKKEIRLAQRWLKRNGSAISSFAASVGVIATGYLAYKSCDDKFQIQYETDFEDLTVKETGKVFWKPVLCGGVTIVCIWLGHGLDQKQIAAMTAAYVALRKSYQEYRDEIRATNPELDKTARENIARSHWDKTYPNEDELYWDAISERYFTASPLVVEKAKYNLNKLFQQTGVVTINDFYGFLGIDKVPGGDERGWDVGMFDAIVSMCLEDYWIDFMDEEPYEIDDGEGGTVKVTAIETQFYPVPLH